MCCSVFRDREKYITGATFQSSETKRDTRLKNLDNETENTTQEECGLEAASAIKTEEIDCCSTSLDSEGERALAKFDEKIALRKAEFAEENKIAMDRIEKMRKELRAGQEKDAESGREIEKMRVRYDELEANLKRLDKISRRREREEIKWRKKMDRKMKKNARKLEKIRAERLQYQNEGEGENAEVEESKNREQKLETEEECKEAPKETKGASKATLHDPTEVTVYNSVEELEKKRNELRRLENVENEVTKKEKLEGKERKKLAKEKRKAQCKVGKKRTKKLTERESLGASKDGNDVKPSAICSSVAPENTNRLPNNYENEKINGEGTLTCAQEDESNNASDEVYGEDTASEISSQNRNPQNLQFYDVIEDEEGLADTSLAQVFVSREEENLVVEGLTIDSNWQVKQQCEYQTLLKLESSFDGLHDGSLVVAQLDKNNSKESLVSGGANVYGNSALDELSEMGEKDITDSDGKKGKSEDLISYGDGIGIKVESDDENINEPAPQLRKQSGKFTSCGLTPLFHSPENRDNGAIQEDTESAVEDLNECKSLFEKGLSLPDNEDARTHLAGSPDCVLEELDDLPIDNSTSKNDVTSLRDDYPTEEIKRTLPQSNSQQPYEVEENLSLNQPFPNVQGFIAFAHLDDKSIKINLQSSSEDMAVSQKNQSVEFRVPVARGNEISCYGGDLNYLCHENKDFTDLEDEILIEDMDVSKVHDQDVNYIEDVGHDSEFIGQDNKAHAGKIDFCTMSDDDLLSQGVTHGEKLVKSVVRDYDEHTDDTEVSTIHDDLDYKENAMCEDEVGQDDSWSSNDIEVCSVDACDFNYIENVILEEETNESVQTEDVTVSTVYEEDLHCIEDVSYEVDMDLTEEDNNVLIITEDIEDCSVHDKDYDYTEDALCEVDAECAGPRDNTFTEDIEVSIVHSKDLDYIEGVMCEDETDEYGELMTDDTEVSSSDCNDLDYIKDLVYGEKVDYIGSVQKVDIPVYAFHDKASDDIKSVVHEEKVNLVRRDDSVEEDLEVCSFSDEDFICIENATDEGYVVEGDSTLTEDFEVSKVCSEDLDYIKEVIHAASSGQNKEVQSEPVEICTVHDQELECIGDVTSNDEGAETVVELPIHGILFKGKADRENTDALVCANEAGETCIKETTQASREQLTTDLKTNFFSSSKRQLELSVHRHSLQLSVGNVAHEKGAYSSKSIQNQIYREKDFIDEFDELLDQVEEDIKLDESRSVSFLRTHNSEGVLCRVDNREPLKTPSIVNEFQEHSGCAVDNFLAIDVDAEASMRACLSVRHESFSLYQDGYDEKEKQTGNRKNCDLETPGDEEIVQAEEVESSWESFFDLPVSLEDSHHSDDADKRRESGPPGKLLPFPEEIQKARSSVVDAEASFVKGDSSEGSGDLASNEKEPNSRQEDEIIEYMTAEGKFLCSARNTDTEKHDDDSLVSTEDESAQELSVTDESSKDSSRERVLDISNDFLSVISEEHEDDNPSQDSFSFVSDLSNDRSGLSCDDRVEQINEGILSVLPEDDDNDLPQDQDSFTSVSELNSQRSLLSSCDQEVAQINQGISYVLPEDKNDDPDSWHALNDVPFPCCRSGKCSSCLNVSVSASENHTLLQKSRTNIEEKIVAVVNISEQLFQREFSDAFVAVARNLGVSYANPKGEQIKFNNKDPRNFKLANSTALGEEESLWRAKEKLQASLKEMEDKNKALKEIVDFTNKENEKLMDKVIAIKEEARTHQMEQKALQTELETTKLELKRLTCREEFRERELTNLKNDIEKKESKLKDMIDELDYSKMNNEDLMYDIELLEEKLSTTEESNEELNFRVDELDIIVAELKRTSNVEHDGYDYRYLREEIELLQGSLKLSKHKEKGLQCELEELEEGFKESRDEDAKIIQKYKQHIFCLTKETSRMKSELSKVPSIEDAKQLNDLKEEQAKIIKELQDQLAALENDHSRVSEELDIEKLKVLEIEGKLSDVEEENTRIVCHLQKKLVSLEIENVRIVSEISKMSEKENALSELRDEKAKVTSQLQQQKTDFEREKSRMVAELIKMSDNGKQVRELLVQVETLRNQNKNLQEAANEAKEQLENKMVSSPEETREDERRSMKKLKNTKREMKKLKRRIQESEQELGVLKRFIRQRGLDSLQTRGWYKQEASQRKDIKKELNSVKQRLKLKERELEQAKNALLLVTKTAEAMKQGVEDMEDCMDAFFENSSTGNEGVPSLPDDSCQDDLNDSANFDISLDGDDGVHEQNLNKAKECVGKKMNLNKEGSEILSIILEEKSEVKGLSEVKEEREGIANEDEADESEVHYAVSVQEAGENELSLNEKKGEECRGVSIASGKKDGNDGVFDNEGEKHKNGEQDIDKGNGNGDKRLPGLDVLPVMEGASAGGLLIFTLPTSEGMESQLVHLNEILKDSVEDIQHLTTTLWQRREFWKQKRWYGSREEARWLRNELKTKKTQMKRLTKESINIIDELGVTIKGLEQELESTKLLLKVKTDALEQTEANLHVQTSSLLSAETKHKDTVEKLQEELVRTQTSLKKRTDELEEIKAQLQLQTSLFTSTEAQQKDTVKELQRDLESIRISLRETKTAADESEAKLKSESGLLVTEKTKHWEIVKQLQGELEGTQTMLKEKTNALGHTETKLQEQTSALVRAEKIHKDALQQIQGDVKRISGMLNEKTKALEQTKSELTLRLADTEASHEEVVKKLQGELQSTQFMLREKTEALNDVEAKLQLKMCQRLAGSERDHAGIVKQLQRDLESKEHVLKEKTHALEKTEIQLKLQMSVLDTMQAKHDDVVKRLKDDLSSVRMALKEKQSALGEAVESLRMKQSVLSKLQDKENEEKQNGCATIRRLKEDLEKSENTLKKKTALLEQTRLDLQLKASLLAAKDSKHEGTVKQLEGDLQKAQYALQEKEVALKKAEFDLQLKSSKVTSLQAKVSLRESELETLKLTHKGKELELERVTGSLSDLKKVVEISDVFLAEQNKELVSVKTSLSKKSRDLEKMKFAVAPTQDELKLVSAELGRAKIEKAKLSREVVAATVWLEGEKTTADMEKKVLREQVNSALEDLKEKTKEIWDLKLNLKESRIKARRLESDKQDMEETGKDFKEKVTREIKWLKKALKTSEEANKLLQSQIASGKEEEYELIRKNQGLKIELLRKGINPSDENVSTRPLPVSKRSPTNLVAKRGFHSRVKVVRAGFT